MDESRMSKLEAWQRRKGVSQRSVLLLCGTIMALIGFNVVVFELQKVWTLVDVVGMLIGDTITLASVIAMALARALKPPDFVTKHGTAFWVDDIPEVTETLMTRTLDRFLKVMSEERSDINQLELRRMLSKTGVEWKHGRVSITIGRHELFNKDGIQHGYRLLLRWPGNVAESALYHELLHEVNQIIRLPGILGTEARADFHAVNIRHEESEWWGLEAKMADDF